MVIFLLFLEFQLLLRFGYTLVFHSRELEFAHPIVEFVDTISLILLQETIKNAIEDSITRPVRKVIPIVPGDYR